MQSPALTAPANSSESDRGVAGRYSAPLGIKMDSALDTENNLAVHPDKDAATKEAGAAGAAFATEAELSEAAALWPASRLVDVWNGLAGAPPFAELKKVKRFTDRKSAVTRIWNAAQRLGAALEEEMAIAEQDMLRAQQEMTSDTRATKPAKFARTPRPRRPPSRRQARTPPARAALLRPNSAKARARPLWWRSSSGASRPLSAASTANFRTAVIRTLIEIGPSPPASRAMRQAFTVALVKPGRGSWPYQGMNWSSPRL